LDRPDRRAGRRARRDLRRDARRRHPPAEGRRRRRAQAPGRGQPARRGQPALRGRAAGQPAQPLHGDRELGRRQSGRDALDVGADARVPRQARDDDGCLVRRADVPGDRLVARETQYFPSDGQYWAVPATIYAQCVGECPNPCRKYHVSSAIEGAETVASIVLPFLAARKVFQVVKSRSLLAKQTDGNQVGKFITIYMNANVAHRNSVITELGSRLNAARLEGRIEPSGRVPRSRAYSHVFIEQPLDEGLFIYGGFVTDPSE